MLGYRAPILSIGKYKLGPYLSHGKRSIELQTAVNAWVPSQT